MESRTFGYIDGSNETEAMHLHVYCHRHPEISSKTHMPESRNTGNRSQLPECSATAMRWTVPHLVHVQAAKTMLHYVVKMFFHEIFPNQRLHRICP